MSWDAIGAVAELIGAAGVVASLVYLSVQIRANTRATRASASFEAIHSWAQLNEQFAQLPDSVLESLLRVNDPHARAADFAATEYYRFALGYRAVFQKLEGQFYLFKYGLLEPDIWRQRSRVARGYLELPLFREWWENELRIATFTDEFVAAVGAAEPIDASIVNRAPVHGERGA